MAISPIKVRRIIEAHEAGLLDPAIAQYAEISLATVKRHRDCLGLGTNCVTAQRGKLGERLAADKATTRGLSVHWHERERDAYDLIISGQRVDAKATMQLADGSWRFRLPSRRPSNYGQYHYGKNYATDCEVIVLVALCLDGTADYSLLSSINLPPDIRIRRGGIYETFRNDWTLLEANGATIQA